METLKRLKNELGVYGMRSNNEDIAKCLNSTKCLFVKTWNNMPHIGNFTLTNLPGKEVGLSGSVIGGLHLGINKNISEKKKQNIAIIIEYIVRKELQYQTSMKFGFLSALKEVYENDSICQKYQQCQDFKSIQHILRPINTVENDKEYFKKYRNFLLKYLYNNDNLQECLQGIKYLTNVFYLDNSKFMIQYSVVVGFTDLIMIICYFLSYIKTQRHKFKQLSKFYWFLYLLGIIIIMSFGFTGIGEITTFKCRIRPLVLSFGFTLSNTVILTRMLANFPESEIHFSRFCRNHFNRAIIISILFDVFLYSLTLINPTVVNTVKDGNRLYSKCTVVSTLNIIALVLIYLYKFTILLGMALAIFTEWNVEECKYDVHYAIAILFISFIACIIFCSLQGLHIFKLSFQFIIPSCVAYMYSVSCFFSYFIIRFFSKYSDENDEEFIIKKARAIGKSEKALNHFGSSDKTSGSMSSNQSSNSIPQKKRSFVEHLINLHNFGDEIKKSNEALRNSNISSSTNLSGTKVNIRKSSYGASLDSIRNFDDSITMARRASQITAIPENKIADSYAGSQSFNSTGQDSNNSDEHFTRTRTRSCDNFNQTFNRTQRINSTPNKKYTGFVYGPYKRSVDSFTNPNSTLNRKGSGLSFTNVQPINASSYSNISSRKCSQANSINNSTTSLSNSDRYSNNNINTTGNGRSSDFIFNIQNIDLEHNNSTNNNVNNVITTIKEENKNSLNVNGNDNEHEYNIKNDATMVSVNPSVFTTTSFKSANDE
ncbi:hypothetical protein H8356DRAFT_1081048 [Neocallimastix lanati (nom. inval.)]|nr:hypothetical protein H8356DRAFT_1081048 [Neocallimastix sp. JGI-2020a]